eukprot:Nitzschia sp. Nitz4//scaffold7_size249615//93580//93930//NITZ4_001164-RA/size249615-processed-gene-0.289-mRNA-1//1//CDS//3329558403//7498//frame0
MVDPITFSENFDVSCHLDDYVLDNDSFHRSSPKKEAMPPSSPRLQTALKSTKKKKSSMPKKSRSFSDSVEIFLIPDDRSDVNLDDLFYSDEEISDMRHEAFLESCGLSMEDFPEFE